VWDSAMAAVIATWIMNTEEDGMEGGLHSRIGQVAHCKQRV
jgi:hypothetical protein